MYLEVLPYHLNDDLDNFVVKTGENYEDIVTYDAIVISESKINESNSNMRYVQRAE